MLALGFGLTAALTWAIHDFLARKVAPGAALLPMIAMVLATGCLFLAPLALMADWSHMTAGAWYAGITGGLTLAVALGSLYKAFAIAPVRLVSPVVGAYPLLILLIAIAQGREVTAVDWIAVTLIVAGIAIVAMAARDDTPELYAAPPAVALGWAALSAVGYATTFSLGQIGARLGSELPVILIGRAVALVAIVAVAIAVTRRNGPRPPRAQLGILAVMGGFDALALGLVTASGALPKAEYASVASSLFGVLTVILAAWFLNEAVRPRQWLGIATVFVGIAVLGLQGG